MRGDPNTLRDVRPTVKRTFAQFAHAHSLRCNRDELASIHMKKQFFASKIGFVMLVTPSTSEMQTLNGPLPAASAIRNCLPTLVEQTKFIQGFFAVRGKSGGDDLPRVRELQPRAVHSLGHEEKLRRFFLPQLALALRLSGAKSHREGWAVQRVGFAHLPAPRPFPVPSIERRYRRCYGKSQFNSRLFLAAGEGLRKRCLAGG